MSSVAGFLGEHERVAEVIVQNFCTEAITKVHEATNWSASRGEYSAFMVRRGQAIVAKGFSANAELLPRVAPGKTRPRSEREAKGPLLR